MPKKNNNCGINISGKKLCFQYFFHLSRPLLSLFFAVRATLTRRFFFPPFSPLLLPPPPPPPPPFLPPKLFRAKQMGRLRWSGRDENPLFFTRKLWRWCWHHNAKKTGTLKLRSRLHQPRDEVEAKKKYIYLPFHLLLFCTERLRRGKERKKRHHREREREREREKNLLFLLLCTYTRHADTSSRVPFFNFPSPPLPFSIIILPWSSTFLLYSHM